MYTAEQARNLMDGRITLHWDAALLEVTLLASSMPVRKSLIIMRIRHRASFFHRQSYSMNSLRGSEQRPQW